MLPLIVACARECLAIRVPRRARSHEVFGALAEVMLERGIPPAISMNAVPQLLAVM